MKMTKDNIVRMALEAAGGMLSYDGEGNWRLSEAEVEHFAALVAAAEREDVLDLVDSYAKNNTDLRDAIRTRLDV